MEEKKKINQEEMKKISGGRNNGHAPQLRAVVCDYPGCFEIVTVDVANQLAFTCPKGHINAISKE